VVLLMNRETLREIDAGLSRLSPFTMSALRSRQPCMAVGVCYHCLHSPAIFGRALSQ